MLEVEVGAACAWANFEQVDECTRRFLPQLGVALITAIVRVNLDYD
jgi:hypothetical protein